MQEDISSLLEKAKADIENTKTIHELENIRAHYIGKKGLITNLFKEIPKLPPEERPAYGEKLNHAKDEIERLYKSKKEFLDTLVTTTQKTFIDLTLPPRTPQQGSLHPITQILDEIITIFKNLGFSIADGPEVEYDYYNFEALNIPPEHPARDMQDTFYINDKIVLRTHTSPIQIRTMERQKPPLKIIAPGKVYRCDSDLTHTPMFHQIEGLHVDKGISFANLKDILIQFLQAFFGKETKVRFRPSYFPFTEPSAEVDISCMICNADGCRVCKGTGWLEVLGAGMVHPQLFRNVGYDPNIWSGYAFGLGIERFTMLKFGINDIRLFYENDIRFLEQFK